MERIPCLQLRSKTCKGIVMANKHFERSSRNNENWFQFLRVHLGTISSNNKFNSKCKVSNAHRLSGAWAYESHMKRSWQITAGIWRFESRGSARAICHSLCHLLGYCWCLAIYTSLYLLDTEEWEANSLLWRWSLLRFYTQNCSSVSLVSWLFIPEYSAKPLIY